MSALANTLRELGVNPARLQLSWDEQQECWSLVSLTDSGEERFLEFPASPAGQVLAAELAATIGDARACSAAAT